MNVDLHLVRRNIRHGHRGVHWIRTNVGREQANEVGPHSTPGLDETAKCPDVRDGEIIS